MLGTTRLIFAALALTCSPLVAAQTDARLPSASDSDDIVVTALRIPRGKLPTSINWDFTTILTSKMVREGADFYVRCALNLTDSTWIRGVVDGEPNSAPAQFAQGRIVRGNPGCYTPNPASGHRIAMGLTTPTMESTSMIDRGAIIDRVLRLHAPDAALTRADTQDAAVQSRFFARESWRNRLRLPVDRDALVLASCLVREQPGFATRIVRSEPGSLLERGLTQGILIEGRSCLQGARAVTIDPTFLRTYISDAFYRWVVAARGVDSLIPRAG